MEKINITFIAGRCFSCSYIGLGGPREMNTTGQMGVAVWLAASVWHSETRKKEAFQNWLKN